MTDMRTAIVQYAQAQIGKPYVWGGTGPNGYDCSGLVYAAYKAAGLPAVRETAAQFGRAGVAVDQAHAKPGDIVYYDEPGAVDHVGLYVGGGKMIDAPTEGKPVELVNVGKFTSIRELPIQPGDAGQLSQGTSLGDVLSDPVGAVTSGMSAAFSGWQSDATTIGLKIAGAATAAALLVFGLRETVKGSSS